MGIRILLRNIKTLLSLSSPAVWPALRFKYAARVLFAPTRARPVGATRSLAPSRLCQRPHWTMNADRPLRNVGRIRIGLGAQMDMSTRELHASMHTHTHTHGGEEM